MPQARSQFDIMSELAADRSSWVDIRLYPPTVLCRRLIRLVDFAAEDPKRWRTCRLVHEAPELSYREVGTILGISMRTVMRHIMPVDLAARDDDFTAWELCDRLPEWFAAPVPRNAQRSLTYRRAIRLCTFAEVNPKRWQVIRCAHSIPDAPQEQIAEVTGVCQKSVCNYLQPVRLDDESDFFDDDF